MIDTDTGTDTGTVAADFDFKDAVEPKQTKAAD